VTVTLPVTEHQFEKANYDTNKRLQMTTCLKLTRSFGTWAISSSRNLPSYWHSVPP